MQLKQTYKTCHEDRMEYYNWIISKNAKHNNVVCKIFTDEKRFITNAIFIKNHWRHLAKQNQRVNLHYIFCLSLSISVFPKLWKNSFLIPKYKSGTKGDVTNYRGVIIQSNIRKVFVSMFY